MLRRARHLGLTLALGIGAIACEPARPSPDASAPSGPASSEVAFGSGAPSSTPLASGSPSTSPEPGATAASSPTPAPTPAPTRPPTPAPTPRGTTISDPAGDLTDIDTDAATEAPLWVDVLELNLEVADGELLARFTLAGDPPEALDALYETVGYYLLVDTGGSAEYEYTVDLSSTDDWSGTVFDVAKGRWSSGPDFPGSATTVEELVLIRVPLAAIGSPASLRVQGLVQYEGYPDPINDPLRSVSAEDAVPSESDWVELSS